MTPNTLPAAATILIAAFAGASCAETPAAPTLTTTFTMATPLLPGNEVPPVTNADATASGTVTVTLTVTRDSAGSITGGTADFVVNMANFPAGTTLTGAHIHQAVAGVNAGIFLNTGLANGEVVLGTGTGSFTKTGVNVPAATANALAGGIACYFNVHTSLNPGGAIRGQLVLQ